MKTGYFKKILSKKKVYVPIIIFIFILAVIAFCCTPASLVRRSALIRLAVTIPINILFQLLLFLSVSVLIFYVLRNLIREDNKIKRLISDIICGSICVFITYGLITDSYNSVLRGSVKGDLLLWKEVLTDLSDNDIESIDNLKIKDFYLPGKVSHTYARRDSLYIVAVGESGNDFRFSVTEKDRSQIIGYDDSKSEYGKIEYYKNSGLMKTISFSDEVKETSNVQTVEITLT